MSKKVNLLPNNMFEQKGEVYSLEFEIRYFFIFVLCYFFFLFKIINKRIIFFNGSRTLRYLSFLKC